MGSRVIIPQHCTPYKSWHRSRLMRCVCVVAIGAVKVRADRMAGHAVYFLEESPKGLDAIF